MNGQLPEQSQPQGVVLQSSPRTKFPIGLLLVIAFTGLSILLLLSCLANPRFIVGTHIVTGTPVVVYVLAELGLNVTLFIWLLQRKYRGRILGIALNSYYVLWTIVDSLIIVFRTEEFVKANDLLAQGPSNTMSPGVTLALKAVVAVVCLVMNGAVVAYLITRKRHFKE